MVVSAMLALGPCLPLPSPAGRSGVPYLEKARAPGNGDFLLLRGGK